MMSPAEFSVDRNVDKRVAAEAAVAEVQHGMLVGLGTGSTMAYVLAALGERVRHGLRFDAVATSFATADRATRAGLRVVDFAGLDGVDIAIDGADEIDGRCRAIKGAGGALLREKIVAAAAVRMIAVVDDRKLVEHLGRGPLPVEVLPFALTVASRTIADLGATVVERNGPAGPFRTDQANAIVDCQFAGGISDRLAAALSSIPGVVGHGLFLTEIDAVYIGRGGNAWCRERSDGGRASPPPVDDQSTGDCHGT